MVGLALLTGCPSATPVDNTNDNQPVAASAEIGYTDEGGVSYTPVSDGEVMPLFTSGQGGSHMFAVIRAAGFPVDESGNAEVTLHQYATLAPDAIVVHDFTQVVTFSRLDNGQITTPERIVIFNALPEDVDGQLITITFNLTSVADPTITTTLQQTLLMQLQ